MQGSSLELGGRISDQHTAWTCEGALLQHYLFSPQDHVFLTPSLGRQRWCSGPFSGSTPALQACRDLLAAANTAITGKTHAREVQSTPCAGVAPTFSPGVTEILQTQWE